MNLQSRIIAALLVAALSACSKGGGPSGAPAPGQRVNSWTKPHVLRYATAEDIATLNPLLNPQTTLSFMNSLTMAFLIKFDASNNPIPELATQVPSMQNGGVSKDGLTITYHLRKGVKWSDGAPFNADDVVWTYHAIMNPANNVVSRSGWDDIVSADEPDKYTVVFHLRKPYSPFVESFFSSYGGNPSILPKHLLAQYPDINHVAYNSLPVGIGPFKYKKWERAQRVVMVANPYYFRGMPKLKEIDFEIIPERNTVMTEMQAKALDLWALVPGSYLAKMKQMSGFTYFQQPAYRFNHIDFNVTRPAVKDPAVRRALLYAVDRATLRHKLGHDNGYLQDQPSPRTSPYWDPKIGFTPFDIQKANSILDGAGWKMGPNGIRSKNGVSLSLDVATSSGTADVDQMIEMIRQWWKQIGVSMTVKHYPSPLMFDTYANNGVVMRGNFDMVFFAWGSDAIGDYSNLYACDQFPPRGQNDVRWCNPVADKAMHDLYKHYDQGQRNKDVAVVMEQLQKDVPTIVTTGGEDTFFYNRDLKNFHPGALTPFDNMMNVDI
jgi:peptide/nickel transport system substrate-binding protein